MVLAGVCLTALMEKHSLKRDMMMGGDRINGFPATLKLYLSYKSLPNNQ